MEAMDRRSFFKVAGMTGLALGTMSLSDIVYASSDDEESIRMGIIAPLSGPYAQVGYDSLKGAKVVKKEFGKVLGEPVDLMKYNTKGQESQARSLVSGAMKQKGVKFFFGGVSSAVALTVSDVTNQNHGVFVTTAGADAITGKDCAKSTFRWSTPTYGAIRETVLPLLQDNPSLKKWYTITPNYVFGESLLQNCKQVLKENGADLVGNSTHSLKETNFTSYLTNAISAQPDVLVVLNFGSQTTATLKEALSLGMQKRMKILTVWAAGLDQYEALGPGAVEGLYFGCQYWHGIDTKINNAFVKNTENAIGSPPNYPMSGGFVGYQIIEEGMRKANSTDPGKIVDALEGLSYEGLTGTEKIRAQDHQVVKQYYLLKGKAKSKMKDKYDYMDILSHGASVPPLEDSKCHMKSWGT
jgi:branched-chain amino acid transport system substrate-binding protein